MSYKYYITFYNKDLSDSGYNLCGSEHKWWLSPSSLEGNDPALLTYTEAYTFQGILQEAGLEEDWIISISQYYVEEPTSKTLTSDEATFIYEQLKELYSPQQSKS